jgi:hypothetical protein
LLLLLALKKLRLKDLQSARLILVLRSLALAGNNNSGWHMREPDGGVSFIDVLPTSSGGTIGIDLQISFVNRHIHLFLDIRCDTDRGERGMAPSVGVKRRDSNESMHA